MTEIELKALKKVLALAEEYCDEYNLYNAHAVIFNILEKYIKEHDG